MESRPPNRCSSLTQAGKPCKAWALEGTETCLTHGRTGEERKQAALKAAARSAEVRAERVQEREELERSARMGLVALMGRETEGKARELVARLVALALSPDDSTAIQGQKLLYDRVYGRAIQPTRDDTPTIEGALVQLDALSLEELAALAHGLPQGDKPA